MGGNIKMINKRKIHNELIADLKLNKKKFKSITLKAK